MPQGNNWKELLNDSEYKDQTIEMIKKYLLALTSEILPRSTAFIIASGENEYFILPARNEDISGCNHDDAGTRLVLHSSKVDF